jgi:hypothetical protein
MNNPNLERLIYIVVILLCATVLALVAYSNFFQLDTKVVYQGF